MPDYVLSDSTLPPYMAFPRFLMDMELNDTARMVYMLLDCCQVSQKNSDWCDESGVVFIMPSSGLWHEQQSEETSGSFFMPHGG